MMAKIRSLVVLAAAAATVGGALPASAGPITLAVSNPGGSRTVFVEDLLGNSLTKLDFGTLRQLPIRVRVVDAAADTAGFTVTASVTNLYMSTGQSLDFAQSVSSGNVSVTYPTTPVDALAVGASVAPLLNLAGTVPAPLCTALTLAAVSCNLSLTALEGKVQALTGIPVDLSDLTNLPLVPQTGQAGAFTNPAYAGVAANAPQPAGPPTPTALRVSSGSLNLVSSALNALNTALASVVSGSALSSVVDSSAVAGAVRSVLPAAVVSVFDALTPTQLAAVIASFTAQAQGLVPGQVTALTGTYLSVPIMHVSVPSDAARGEYQGTLVVTATQA